MKIIKKITILCFIISVGCFLIFSIHKNKGNNFSAKINKNHEEVYDEKYSKILGENNEGSGNNINPKYEIINYLIFGKENLKIISKIPIKIILPGIKGNPYFGKNEKFWKVIKNDCENIGVNKDDGYGLSFGDTCYFKDKENTFIWSYLISDFANILSDSKNIHIGNLNELSQILKNEDKDGDGINNTDELITKNDILDTDFDGWSDGEEINLGSDPLDSKNKPKDTNSNFLADNFEIKLKNECNNIDETSPNDDCDSDLLSNRLEQQYGTNPNEKDSDSDGISDLLEIISGLNPNNKEDALIDYDLDGITNIDEIITKPFDVIVYNSSGNLIKNIKQNIINNGIWIGEIISESGSNYLDNEKIIENIISNLGNNGEHINFNFGLKNTITNIFSKDSDFDGLSDLEEKIAGTNPNNPDTDFDGIIDGFDDKPLQQSNSGKNIIDLDQDLLPDFFEEKISNGKNTNGKIYTSKIENGILVGKNEIEAKGIQYKLDKSSKDSNGNGIFDGDEDFDLDGLTNKEEFIYGTNPNNFDTDGDFLSDKNEIINNLNPLKNDSNYDDDGDLLSNVKEISGFTGEIIIYKKGKCSIDNSGGEIETKISTGFFTNPNNFDTDGDGLNDLKETFLHTDPNNKDTDSDGILDGIEIKYNTNPNCQESDTGILDVYKDSDKDGLFDETEKQFQNHTGNIYLNINNSDSNNNGLSDGMEDFDNDGLNNIEEQEYQTELNKEDSDNDGYNDFVEIKNGTSPINKYSKPNTKTGEILNLFIEKYGKNKLFQTGNITPFELEDIDQDGLNNIEEQKLGTNPIKKDTDGDAKIDGKDNDPLSCGSNYNCNKIDSDGDGISDKEEINGWIGFGGNKYFTNYLNKDTDNDGLLDGYEKSIGSNPMNPDTNGNGFLDGVEINVSKLRGIKPSFNLIIEDKDKDGIPDEFNKFYNN